MEILETNNQIDRVNDDSQNCERWSGQEKHRHHRRYQPAKQSTVTMSDGTIFWKEHAKISGLVFLGDSKEDCPPR